MFIQIMVYSYPIPIFMLLIDDNCAHFMWIVYRRSKALVQSKVIVGAKKTTSKQD